MQYSKYQLNVFDHFKQRAGNSAVISVAGSGKTFTALEGIGFINPMYSVLLGAFNKDIRTDFEAKGQAKGYNHVKYTTYNAFGWGIVFKNMKKAPKLDKDKTVQMLRYRVLKPSTDDGWKQYAQYKYPIEKLVGLFKSLNIHTVEQADTRYNEIVDFYDIQEPAGPFREAVLETFKECINEMSIFDFDDQKYMPLHMGWLIPVFDQVLLDEFQDTCPLELKLMMSAARGGQFCGLGDPDQSIYGFKGATPDAFDNYIRDYNAKVLYLSICYRCPKAVVREAQQFVPRIEAAPGAKEGSVDWIKDQEFMAQVRPGDFVLCRVTEDLVSCALKLIKQGRKAKVRGRDIGDKLVELIYKLVDERANPNVSELATALKEYKLKRVQQLQALERESEIQQLEDRIDTINVLMDDTQYVSDVVRKIGDLFTDQKHDGIDLMTCHKSKGLQNQNVFVIRPDKLPINRPRMKPWMHKQEKCLQYVTATRPTERLAYVEPPRKER